MGGVMWYVYIIECSNGRFYTGITNDVDKRLQTHVEGKGGHYTSTFGVKTLRYKKGYPTKQEAALREQQIKGWSHHKKLKLINGEWT